MTRVRCPACGHDDFTQKNDPDADPDYYNCAKCKTQIIVNTNGFLTVRQREFLARINDD
jgi:DNA-directed RNA polymerase subunit RPC12/RpoP